jgi:hypothetical protein
MPPADSKSITSKISLPRAVPLAARTEVSNMIESVLGRALCSNRHSAIADRTRCFDQSEFVGEKRGGATSRCLPVKIQRQLGAVGSNVQRKS